MEKYGAFRDKGSGIAPFFPIPREPAGLSWPAYAFLAFIRIPLLLTVTIAYFLIFSWMPLGALAKKALLWVILGVPGIWWVDLQVDGVKRGSLGRNPNRLPQSGSILVSSFTSPIDALYLAAIFDPVFTRSFPETRSVQQISLWQAIWDAFVLTPAAPPIGARLVDLAVLTAENPDRYLAVFPECTTSNGRAILPFSPSILTAPPKTKLFPVSLRYTPADITTPVPGTYLTFLWNLCSRPTHTIRVRIAEPTYNTAAPPKPRRTSYETNLLDDLHRRPGKEDKKASPEPSEEEKEVLDRIAEALARLGRIKRVGLGVADKIKFVEVWSKRR